MNPKPRPATAADRPQLRILLAAMCAELGDQFDLAPTETNLDRYLDGVILPACRQAQGGAVFVAEDEGKLMGFTALAPNATPLQLRAPTLIDAGTYVVPALRRMRIACALRRAAFDKAAGSGIRCVNIPVHARNMAGRRSAEAAGAKPVAVIYQVEF